MSQLHDDAVALRALLDTEDKWIQNELARNAEGDPVNPRPDDSPTCFCLSGGTIFVTEDYANTDAKRFWDLIQALHHAFGEYENGNVPYWNDSHDWADVDALLDKVVEATA